MLRHAKQEVPSLELGPPSPLWMDQLVGSPLGGLKPATRHEASRSLSPRYETTWIQLLTAEQADSCSETRVQESPQTRHRPVVGRETSSASRTASSASLAGTASCESRKRAKSPSKRYAKKRRVVPSGEKTNTTELEKWSTALTADALSETFLAPSTMDMERDATEEFMNEFWGDLMLDTSPVSNDSLIAATSPFDELLTPLPAAQPDCRLLDDVTEDQLLELAQFLEPGLPESFAPALAELSPPPAPATTEAPVAAPIDLAALLEETEIVFTPKLVAAEEPTVTRPANLLPTPACTPSPPPPAAPAPAPAEPTHYLLVLSAPEEEPAAPAALSVTVESTDDPAFELDGAARSSSASTEAEAEAEVEVEVEELEVVGATGPTRKRAPRRPPPATPAEKYRRIRDTNNEASRRSRQQRKLREVDTHARAAELEEENGRMRQKVEVLESLLEQVKALAPLLTAKR